MVRKASIVIGSSKTYWIANKGRETVSVFVNIVNNTKKFPHIPIQAFEHYHPKTPPVTGVRITMTSNHLGGHWRNESGKDNRKRWRGANYKSLYHICEIVRLVLPASKGVNMYLHGIRQLILMVRTSQNGKDKEADKWNLSSVLLSPCEHAALPFAASHE